MPNRIKPQPKTQQQISKRLIDSTARGSKTIMHDNSKRELQRSVKNDPTKRLHIGLRDIDETIVFYFNNVIKPSVIQNGKRKNVPILYGSPERWKAVQKDGFYRDKNGKIQAPLLMFKRDSVEKNRGLGNKVDPNNPLTYGVFKKSFSKKNIYDRFSVINSRSKVDELYGVIIPDYVTLTYSCLIFTDYIEQMNKIIEAINYASDSYWGDSEKFNFRAKIDSYTTATELTQGQDRAVKTNFTLTMYGYIVPDSVQAHIAGMNKYYSKGQVNFQLETAGTLEELTAKAGTSQAETTVRFIDKDGGGQPPQSTLTPAEIAYLSTNNTFIGTSITAPDTVTFENCQFVSAPTGFNPGVERHMLYINGTFIPTQHYTISEVGSDIVVVVDTTSIQFSINPGDQIVLTGKLETVI